MLLAVIRRGTAVLGDGDGDLADRVDRLEAVGHFEGDGTEVLVGVLELLLGKAHIGGADAGALSLGGAVEREVVLGVQRVADLDIVAGDGVLLAVVRGGVVVADDGDGHIDRGNLERAVGHLERDVEVLVVVRELRLREAHRVGVDVRALGDLGAAEGEVGLLVERVADLDLVALDLLLLAVVRLAVLVARDGDGDRAGGDLDGRVLLDVEGHVEVAVRVGELVLRQAELGLANVGAGHADLSGRGHHGVDVVHLVGGGHGPGGGVLGAVVGLLDLLAGDGDGDLAGGNRDGRVLIDDEGHVEVAVRVGELVLREAELGGAHVGAGHVRCRGRGHHGVDVVHLVGGGHSPGGGVRLAVVGLHDLLAGDGDGDRTGGDRNRARIGDDALVVAGDVRAIAGDGVGVRVVVRRVVGDVGHAGSGGGDRHDVAVGKREDLAGGVGGDRLVLVGDGVGLVLVELAVVLVAAGGGRDDEGVGVLGDGELAVGRGHEVVADRGLLAGLDRGAVDRGDDVGLGAHVGDRGVGSHDDGELVLVGLGEALDRELGLGQRGAVVCLVGALGGDGDRARLDGVGAGNVRDVVVIGHVRRRDFGSVKDRSAGNPMLSRTDFRSKGVLGERLQPIAVGQLAFAGLDVAVQHLAVVHLLRISADDVEMALADGEGAVDVRDLVVAGGVADGGRGRDDLARVGAGVGLAARERDAGELVGALEALDGHVGVEALGVGAGRTLRLAVVGVVLRLRRDGERGLGDLERAVGRGHEVVADLGLDSGRYGGAVDGGDDVGLGARVGDRGLRGHLDGEGMGIALGEALDLELGLRQRGAVVDLVCVLGGDGDLLGLDGEVGILVGHVVVVRDALFGLMVEGHRSGARDDLVGVGAGVGLAARERDGGQGIAALKTGDGHVGVEALGVGAGRALRLAVVGVGLILGGDGEVGLLDGEGAVVDHEGDVVVARGLAGPDDVLGEAHRVGVGVGALHDGLLAGHIDAVGCGAARIVDGDREAIETLLRAVVRDGLLLAGDGDGDGSLIDGQRADIGDDALVVAGGVGVSTLDGVGVGVVVARVVGDVGHAGRGGGDRHDVAVGEREHLASVIGGDGLAVVGDGVDLFLVVLPVVGPALRCGRDHEGARVLRDGEGAIGGGDDVVADLLRLALGDGGAVDGGDDVGLGAHVGDRGVGGHDDGELMGVALGETLDRELGLGQRSAVVDLVGIFGGDGDGLRGDLERAVDGGHEVVADCGLLASRNGDVVDRGDDVGLGSLVRDRGIGGHDDGELVGVALGEALDLELGLRQCGAVVCLVGALGGDGDLRRIDLHIAVSCNGERRGDVNVAVAELAGVEVHLRRSDIRLRSRGLSAVAHLARVEQGVIAGSLVALDRVLCTIIVLGVVVSRNGDRELELLDGEVGLSVGDHVVIEDGLVGVVVEHHLGCARDDLVLVGAGVGLLARERDGGKGVAALEAGDGHVGVEALGVGTGRTLLLAVVGVVLVLGGDGELCLGDGQRAGDLDLVVAGAVGLAVGLGDVPGAVVDIVVLAGVDALDGGRALEAERLAAHDARRVGGFQLELLLGAVVGDGAGSGQRDLGLGDGHRAGAGDVLVVGVGSLHVHGGRSLGNVGEGRGGLAPLLAVGRVVELRALGHRRGGGHGVARSVVGAGVVGDGHRHLGLGDGELAGCVGHDVIALDGFARSNHGALGHLDVGDVLDTEGDGVGDQILGLAVHQTGDRGAVGLGGLAVVGLGDVVSGHGDVLRADPHEAVMLQSEGHIEVGVGVGELVDSQVHIRLADDGTGYRLRRRGGNHGRHVVERIGCGQMVG